MGDGVVYAGVTGSSVCGRHTGDVDVVAVVEGVRNPTLTHHPHRISLLTFDRRWLTYEKHGREPVGLIPSILFKTIELSQPIIGDKKALHMPQIRVCEADLMNLEIKKRRFKDVDRKNYLVALVFEKLLDESPNLRQYCFNNIKLAERLGLHEIASELTDIYSKKMQDEEIPQQKI